MSQIKENVKRLVKKYGTNDPFKIAKQMGILIIIEPLGSALGYYNKHARIPMIHINQNASKESQYFICAHELGHAVQHPDTSTTFLKKYTLLSTDRIEIEANTFAIELLLQDEYFNEQNSSHFTVSEAIENYGIPSELLYLKDIEGKKIYP